MYIYWYKTFFFHKMIPISSTTESRPLRQPTRANQNSRKENKNFNLIHLVRVLLLRGRTKLQKLFNLTVDFIQVGVLAVVALL